MRGTGLLAFPRKGSSCDLSILYDLFYNMRKTPKTSLSFLFFSLTIFCSKMNNLLPFLPWPLATVVGLAVMPNFDSGVPRSKRFEEPIITTNPWTHLSIIVSAGAWKIMFAAFVLGWFNPLDKVAALTLDSTWILNIAARNLLLTWLTGGLWDFLHLSTASPFFSRLAPLKFSDTPVRDGQIPHDAFWASMSALVSSAWEVFIWHHWAHGTLPLSGVTKWWTHVPTIAWLLALPHLQIIHFWMVHRFMHRWFPRKRSGVTALIPDIGQLLYTWVHSLHHLSRDPTAFSGISMHPVESALFFTTMPLFALAGCHPVVILHAQFYNIVQAMIGHESYGGPSTGGHFHWLHHQLINCNYGGPFIPLDALFGTAVLNVEEFEEKIEGKRQ